MLPNHAPLVIAEQFGTLEALYPGRIDLGLGRAPGADMLTARALRRDLTSKVDSFPDDVVELLSYFHAAMPDQRVRAVPGAGLEVPIWILGSSLFGAELAAHLGLPYAFASHFAPDALIPALHSYFRGFKASEQLDRPYAAAGVNIFAADTDQEARRLFKAGERSPEGILDAARNIIATATLARVDYLELVNADTLKSISEANRDSLLAVAAFFGQTRLIDNVRLS
jgi:luciferase family oxidoreductase group 1